MNYFANIFVSGAKIMFLKLANVNGGKSGPRNANKVPAKCMRFDFLNIYDGKTNISPDFC